MPRVLYGFEANLAILFGAGFADPDNATSDDIQLVVAGDDFDELSAPKPEAAPKAKSFRRTVHDEAGNTLRLRAEINDHASSLSHGGTFGASAFVRG